MSFNRLAYVYLELGQFDQALTAVDAYMRLTPAEPNPYDTRGDILSRMGLVDEATSSYQLALERKRDFFPSLQSLGRIYLLKGDYDLAENFYRKLGEVDDPGAQWRSSLFLSCIPLFQGKLDEALARLDHYAEEDLRKQQLHGCLAKKSIRSMILLEKGEEELALSDFRQALDDRNRDCEQIGLGWPVATIKLVSAVDMKIARTYLDSIKIKAETYSAEKKHAYWFCKGWIEMCEGRPEDAIISFKRGSEIAEKFYLRYQLALAYLKANQIENAIQEFENVLNISSSIRVKYALWSVKAHYYLGLAYLENGDPDSARKELITFLDTWKDADWECEEIAAAKDYVANLTMNQPIP